VRVDRVVAASVWSDRFPGAKLHHLISGRSDHLSILLDVDQEVGLMQHTKIARYEIMWERESSLAAEIGSAWSSGRQVTHLGDVVYNLKGVMNSLQWWSREKFGAVTKELERLREKLEHLCSSDHAESEEEIKPTRQRMDELLHREEMMWLQRSRISWLQEGDQNTRYFHRRATARAKKKIIKGLRNEEGQLTQDRKMMEGVAMEFFKDLYRADPTVQVEGVAANFNPDISDATNVDLV
jgi:hypothetical protein